MKTINKFNFGEIHLIPFDAGFYFYDKMSDYNLGNMNLANDFLDKLISKYGKDNVVCNRPYLKSNKSKYAEEKDDDKDNKQETIYFGKERRYDLPNTFLCRVKLSDILYCYIAINGIATFVLADFNSNALSFYSNKLNNSELPVVMGMQKKITSYLILEDDDAKTKLFKDIDPSLKCLKIMAKELKLMDDFKDFCWKTLYKNKQGYTSRRSLTASEKFRHNGFSYVMNILISKEIKDDEINYLLNGQTPSFYTHSKDYIEECNKHYQISKKIVNHLTTIKFTLVIMTSIFLEVQWL